MNIDQNDLYTFEAVVQQMYKAREDKEHRVWFEAPSTTQLDYRDVIDMWVFKRTAVFFSPMVATTDAIGKRFADKLRVLMTIKQAELKADFTGQGAERVFRALVSDMIERFGWSDGIAKMIDILHALLIGRRMYEAAQGHYPVNEKQFVIAFTANSDAANTHH